MFKSAQLILATGEVFAGSVPNYVTALTFGEVVFNTGMVGYVECLTDPSYRGQILVFTYPLIGNYGVPIAERFESQYIQPRAIVVSELSPFYYRDAKASLLSWCEKENIPIFIASDTRSLTHLLREKGVIAGAISTDGSIPSQFEEVNALDLVAEASLKEPLSYGQGIKKIIALDCGMKENIIRSLSAFPLTIKRVPYDYNFLEEEFDGLFISNGPGDPARCTATIALIKQALNLNKPIFGICLGAQLLALALGGRTYKLRFGHRSQNQPCMNLITKRVYLTSQNHGYAIDDTSLPQDWYVSFRNLNDQTVQGIAHHTKPWFAVQFHPEAAPGPVDTLWLFEQFYQSL